MPDVSANLSEAPARAVEMIAGVLELRASIPQQQDMLRAAYLHQIDFPADAKVLEIGCGTGPVARVLASWPGVDGFVHDRWMVRRMSGLVRGAGFEVTPLRSYGLVETAKPALILTWVDRGADALAGRGQIGEDLAAALKAEARRRVESDEFFGHMTYASLVARKPR